MTISNTLYLAILAMDAYNQNYDPGIAGVGNNIGRASLLQINLASSAKDDGFAASAYSLNGHTVISYRGTDDKFGTAANWFSDSDLLRGWTIGAGLR